MMLLRRTTELLLVQSLLWSFAAARRISHLGTRDVNVSAPIVVSPSQNFEGNDGPWSTFTLQLGTPAQNVNVMISTAGYQTWAVVSQGCPFPEQADCAKSRGGVFNANESSTWVQNNVTTNGTFTLGLEENLGYTGNGLFGYDTVALGWQGSNGPTLNQQIIAGIATPQFYTGIFGLDPRPTNFSNYNRPVPSYMSNLKSQNLIPSLSWGYTAGNQYRLSKALGSLALGGYDASRFQSNNVTFPFNDQDIRALTVGISSIVHDTDSGQQTTLLNESISAFVDSTIPWIYLPLEVCKQFEVAFGLEWDESRQVYLVNDTLHKNLQAQNATVTFILQNSDRKESLPIKLPYAAFDLIATYPLAENQTRYFPLARATNETQYTLGRTFFQEAYVIADYERRNFSVSQCTWNADTSQRIVPIRSPSESSISPAVASHHRSLTGGAVAGVAIGAAFGLAILSFLVYTLIRKRFFAKSSPTFKDDEVDSSHSSIEKPELPGSGNLIGHEIDGMHVRAGTEIDSKQLTTHELEDYEIKHELDDGQHGGAKEMSAREATAAELP